MISVIILSKNGELSKKPTTYPQACGYVVGFLFYVKGLQLWALMIIEGKCVNKL